MKKIFLGAIMAALPTIVAAQSAVDAMSISQSDIGGTARFMSMGGAFTALGGDVSTLGQNPGGIGVYRKNDLSITLDVDMHSSKSSAVGIVNKNSNTNTAINNFGFVGAVDLGSDALPYFNWGVSFNRKANFNRVYGSSLGNIGTSYSNLVADYTTADAYPEAQLGTTTSSYNPYQDPYNGTYAPWSSILFYNAYGINNTGNNSYVGLFDEGYNGIPVTRGGAAYQINESGYIDEYNFTLGGNIMNSVYWGLGFGVTDLNFKQQAYYDESLLNARVLNWEGDRFTHGDAEMNLYNYKRIYGSGVNFKAGVILKPVNEFRLGFAVHTPTYYTLNYQGYATLNTQFNAPGYENQVSHYQQTDQGYFDEFGFKTKSPWRLLTGAAGVIGGRLIISADYEFRATGDIKIQDEYGESYTYQNEDVKAWYQNTNIVRVGGEYRLTPSVSVRAGYSYETSPVKESLLNNNNSNVPEYVYTSGPDDTETQPSFTLDRSTQYVTAGVGYRNSWFYGDIAFVHRTRYADYHAYTNYAPHSDPSAFIQAPSADVAMRDNSLVFTVGVRF